MAGLAMVKKTLRATVLSAAALVVPVWIEPAIIDLPHPWILLGIGIVALVFQPDFNPVERTQTPEDKGTVIQIVWSLYLCNFAALIEAVTIRYPEAFLWDAVSIVALGVMVIGLLVRSWSVLVLGRFFTWTVQVQDDQQVIRSGPYRWVRHPSYTGAFLTYFGLPIWLHCHYSTVLAAIVLPLAFSRRIRHEDALLRKMLDGYDDYTREVKAVIPWLL